MEPTIPPRMFHLLRLERVIRSTGPLPRHSEYIGVVKTDVEQFEELASNKEYKIRERIGPVGDKTACLKYIEHQRAATRVGMSRVRASGFRFYGGTTGDILGIAYIIYSRDVICPHTSKELVATIIQQGGPVLFARDDEAHEFIAKNEGYVIRTRMVAGKYEVAWDPGVLRRAAVRLKKKADKRISDGDIKKSLLEELAQVITDYIRDEMAPHFPARERRSAYARNSKHVHFNGVNTGYNRYAFDMPDTAVQRGHTADWLSEAIHRMHIVYTELDWMTRHPELRTFYRTMRGGIKYRNAVRAIRPYLPALLAQHSESDEARLGFYIQRELKAIKRAKIVRNP